MTQNQKSNINLECDLRFAHIDGHTDLDFISGENKIVTVGIDCEVRVWSLDDDEIKDTFTVEDSIYSVIATDSRKNRCFLAMANNCVQSCNINDGEDRNMVCRFTANATHLSTLPDADLIVAGAADFSIKVVNMENRSEKHLEGHTGPVLSVALDPLAKYVASSSCDGSVCVWSIDSRKLTHQWKNVFPRSNDFENSSTLCRIAWQPGFGELLAVPKSNAVELYKRGIWENVWKQISYPELTDVSIVTFSHDSQFIAASSTKSVVFVWRLSDVRVDNFRPISIMYMAECVTSLKFNPLDSMQFCTTDRSGALRILKILSVEAKTATSIVAEIPVQSLQPQPSASKSSIDKKISNGFSLDELDDIFDDMNDNDFSFVNNEKNKTIDPVNKKSTVVEAENDSTQREVNKMINLYAEKNSAPSDIDNRKDIDFESNLNNDVDAEFDIGAIKSQYEPLIFGEEEQEKKTNNFAETNTLRSSASGDLIIDGQRLNGRELLELLRQSRPAASSVRQAPFQSGSTPVHYKQRFMVWNSVGIVYGYNSDEERSIDIEFHDIAFHHSIHLTNMFNYTMADLSNSCLLLGSNGDDETDDYETRNQARIFCSLLNTWDSIKEWQTNMPKGEQIDAIAAGQTFVAVATNHLYLRLWTTGGIQTGIVSLCGPAVTLAAQNRHLMIAFHQASHFSEQGQSIACQVLKVDHKGKTRCHPISTPVSVALSPKSTIYWAGFTDEGTPCIVDSDGVIRLYKTYLGNGWLPICATKQHGGGKSDNFFIIGISEIRAQIRCIYCKASRYPDTIPKPSLHILPLQIPLCEVKETAKSRLEEEVIRNRVLSTLLKKLSIDGYEVDQTLEDAEKKVINSQIKLFALALGAERESLALEIAGIMANRSALEGAVRYAEKQKHRSLGIKLIEMIQDEDDGNTSVDEGDNSDTELQQLLVRKQADQMQQLIMPHCDDSDSNSRLISLPKYGSESSSSTILKPKALKSGNTSGRTLSRQVITLNADDNDDDKDEADVEILDGDYQKSGHDGMLKPKQLEAFTRNANGETKNPFKVADGNAKMRSTNQRIRESSYKRKKYDEEEDAVEDLTRVADSVEVVDSDEIAFVQYFESVREQMLDDNDDEIDNEDDLLRLVRAKYDALPESEKKKWKKAAATKKLKKSSMAKSTKKRATYADSENSNSENMKANKITNFFKRG